MGKAVLLNGQKAARVLSQDYKGGETCQVIGVLNRDKVSG